MKQDDRLIKLGANTKKIRESKGLSQTKLANSIGKDQQSIQRLEKGNINPSYLYLLDICEGLDIEIEELLHIK